MKTKRRGNYLAYLRGMGFDLSEHIPFTKRYRARCSTCETLVINGAPCHETGCSNLMELRAREFTEEFGQ